MSYVVATSLKAFLSEKGMQTAGDLPDALSAEVEVDLTAAIERAKANGRVTVRPSDL